MSGAGRRRADRRPPDGTVRQGGGFGVVGVAVAACAACCAPAVLVFLGGLGLAGLAGTLLVGAGGFLVAGAAFAGLVIVRRRRAAACATAVAGPVRVAVPHRRSP
jgi:hypothetical protein